VTLGDCELLARETPGVRLARATARAGLDPGLPCFTSPGVISVLVVPFLPRRRPVPSPGLLRAVASCLGRRRVIGTRIEVFGPSYLEIAVRARVRAFPGVPGPELAARVVTALGRFFDPLEGGPDGGGWPFGRDVYRSEVLQVIDETPGVDCVLALELTAAGGAPSCGNVCLGPTTLVVSGAHTVEVA
jgi:predicted phage baseplate assembly protein